METPQTPVATILREQSSEKFRVRVGEREILFPHAGRLSTDLAERMKKQPTQERLWWLLEHVLDEDDLDALDTLSLSEFNRTIDRWMAHGGVRLGESSGS